MSYPEQDLEVTLETAFGADLTTAPNTWVFTDLSDRLIQSPITITQGVMVGAGTSKTGSATGIQCLNDDGWLTPFLETSPWWPYVDAGTPARLSIRTDTTPYLTDSFTRTIASGWGSADSGQAWVLTSGLSVAGGKGLVSVGAVNGQTTNRMADGHGDIDIVFDVSVPAVTTGVAGTANSFGMQMHRSASAVDYLLAVVDFMVGGAIQWTVYSCVATVVTTVTSVVQTGLTYSAGTVIRGRCELVNGRLRCRAWPAAGTEPAVWAVDETIPTAAAAKTTLAAFGWVRPGVTNTLPLVFSVDNITMQQPRQPRIEGYLTGCQPAFWVEADGTERSQVAITIGGIGSRLEKLAADPLSPLGRSILKSGTPPIAYWMGEDKSGATSAASAFSDQPPMTVTGPAVFAFDLGLTDDLLIPRYGLTGICSLAAGAKLSAPVPLTAATAWTVSMEHQSYTPLAGGGITSMRLMEWQTGGTFARWALITTTTSTIVRAYNDGAGTTTDVITFATVYPFLDHYSVKATQNGSNIDVSLLVNAAVQATGSVAGLIGGYAPTRITINPDQANTTASVDTTGIRFLVGHVTVHAAAVAALPFYNDGTLGTLPRADRGWAYEAAHRRAARVAGEDDVPIVVLGDPYTSGVTELNVQQPGTVQPLMTQAVDSESGGLLYEGGFGWVHDPRSNRLNRPPTLTVDMAAYRYVKGFDPREVLVPKLDPRGPNSWTVQRTGGSQATFSADEDFRKRRGTIADKAILDVLYDSDCPPHAQWRVHLDVDGAGANYPNTVIDLAANPDLIDDWLRCVIGSRMQRLNQPTIAGLGTIDQVIDGISETITPVAAGGPGWTASLDTSPADVWDTGIWDSPTSLWQPNADLSADATTTATSWSVNSHGEPWVTGAVSLRAKLGREQVLITNISGAGSAWTFTVTRSVNGVADDHTAGAEKLILLDAGTWALN